MRVKIDIITCPQWGARAPKEDIVIVKKSVRIIFHHTAGHHRELDANHSVESRAEAIGYAKDIQRYHMDEKGWNDSGHNFLVCRNGLILQGRWITVSAIQAGRMVTSAHCPTQNGQIGIEHEHAGSEEMTKAQRESSARLQAWIADKYGRSTVLPVDPHSKYINTSCPANLKEDIAAVKSRAQQILNAV